MSCVVLYFIYHPSFLYNFYLSCPTFSPISSSTPTFVVSEPNLSTYSNPSELLILHDGKLVLPPSTMHKLSFPYLSHKICGILLNVGMKHRQMWKMKHLDKIQPKQYKENKKKMLVQFLNIQQGVKPFFPRIMGAKTSNKAWEILKNEYQGFDRVRLFRFRC